MKTIQISLNSIDKVKSFVNDITKFDYDFDLAINRIRGANAFAFALFFVFHSLKNQEAVLWFQ